MDKMKGLIQSITRSESGGYIVEVTTYIKHEADEPRYNHDEPHAQQRTRSEDFSFLLDVKFKTMTPLDSLQKYFDIYRENEQTTELNPVSKHKWQVAQFIENIAEELFSKNTLEIYELPAEVEPLTAAARGVAASRKKSTRGKMTKKS